YRIGSDGTAARVVDRIDARDEMAFAYRNPRGARRLMVFGVDEHRNVYWYHPGWMDTAKNPVAIPIEPGDQRHELPAAVRHRIEGRSLDVYAVFTNRPLTVREAEQALA